MSNTKLKDSFKSYFSNWSNPNMNNDIAPSMNALGVGVGKIGGNIIGGGLQSGVGNALSGLSGIASALPGAWGTALSAGLGVAGGITNRFFGSKFNQANIDALENAISQANNIKADASDFDSLSDIMGSTGYIGNFDNSYIGSEGLLSNKVGKKAAALREAARLANERQSLALISNAENITADTLRNLESNYMSLGGKIHIKPSKKGTFTSAAKKHGMGVQEFAGRVLANKDNYSPSMVKKANFARNASKWKHSFGGNLFKGGGDTNDYYSRVDFDSYTPVFDKSFIPENMEQIQDSLIARRFPKPLRSAVLGSILHETGGKPDAVSEDGLYKGIMQWGSDRYPNTEDLGEQIHYLMESMQNSESPHWGDGGAGAPYTRTGKEAFDTFWNGNLGPYDATMMFNKGYVRPRATNDKEKAKVAEQERVNRAVEAKNIFQNMKAFGGDLLTHGANFDTGVTLIGNGGSHEDNPLEGVPMGMDDQGTPNLVEEGEVIFNDYVFSKRLKVPKEVRKRNKLGSKPLTFADAAIKVSKESEERPNDPISRAGLEDSMVKLVIAQEQVREKTSKNKFSQGGKMGRKYSGSGKDPNLLLIGDPHDYSWMDEIDKKTSKEGEIPLFSTWQRYIPAYASGIMSVTDALGITNKPDYTEADMVLNASRDSGSFSPVEFSPIGNYVRYTPFDRNYYINQLNAQSGAARRSILQNAGLNRGAAMSALLASDYNAQNQLGQLARQAEEYNLNQRLKAEEFNRGTNMFNTEGAFKANVANQKANLKVRNSYLNGVLSAAGLRQRDKQQSDAARSANLTNFINSLGDIGRENFIMNMINRNKALLYGITRSGDSPYKTKKNGGLLTIRKKRK